MMKCFLIFVTATLAVLMFIGLGTAAVNAQGPTPTAVPSQTTPLATPTPSLTRIQAVTPTTDPTITELQKDKLRQEIQQLQYQNDRRLITLVWNNVSPLITGVVALVVGIFGIVRWFADRDTEREKRAEERFQKVVEGLGAESEATKAGAAVTLRTFLRPGYEQFYAQVFNLAVANLRLQVIPEGSSGPSPLMQALVVVFRESLAPARNQMWHEKSVKKWLTPDIFDRYLHKLHPILSGRARRWLIWREIKRGHFRRSGEPPTWQKNHSLNIQNNWHILDAAEVFLQRAYLADADLEFVWMPRANLQHANLERAKLQWAVLADANLESANIRMAQMQGAQLKKAQIQFANLTGTQLSEAQFQEANLQNAHLEKANLEDANLAFASLRGANLQGANLRRANLQAVSLFEADLRGANLQQADFQGANLRRVNLRGTNIAPEQLAQAASLTGATMPDGSIHD